MVGFLMLPMSVEAINKLQLTASLAGEVTNLFKKRNMSLKEFFNNYINFWKLPWSQS